jgi:signal transduction histidine kinase
VRDLSRPSGPRPGDVAVPAAVLAVGVFELVATAPAGWGYGVALESAAAAALVGRRFVPLVASPLAAGLLLVIPWVGPQLDDVATPILFIALLCYALGRWIAQLNGLVSLAIVATMAAADYLLVDGRAHDFTDVIFVTTLMLPPYVFGRVARRLAVQSEALIAAQEQIRAAAVRAERDRIARDLHDVIAHSISSMVVQTAAAQDLVSADPDRAGALLADVADTGRRALSETGRLLHALRDENDELGLRPAPGLAELPELVEQFRSRGLEVDADLPDPVPTVPAGVDVSAYRIAQEVLTNALRYAADRTVALRVALTGSELSIRTANASHGHAGTGSGLGLLGVAERVKVLGGTLRHEHAGGRFELEAVVPVEGRGGA